MPLFDDIYQAAVTLNRDLLSQIKETNKTLDVWNAEGSVIERLASENNHPAVALLISFGAGINVAGRGYARAGNIEKVKELLRDGASKNWAVSGAAWGGHKDLVTELLRDGASKDWAVLGAALGGHKDLVTELLRDGASKDWAVPGAAQGGHKDLVTELLRDGASKDEAVSGAAWGGHKDLVTQLLRDGASKDEAVRGAAFCGHKDLVTELLRDGASKNSAVRGAAWGGHKDLVTQLLRDGASKDEAVRGAAEGGQKDLENWLRLHDVQYIKDTYSVELLKPQTIAMQAGWEKALENLAGLHHKKIPGAKEAFTEVCVFHTTRAKNLMVHGSEEDKKVEYDLLKKLAGWGHPDAMKFVGELQEKRMQQLLKPASHGDKNALEELTRMTSETKAAFMFLGRAYLNFAEENPAAAQSSSFLSFFRGTPFTQALQTFETALKHDITEANYYVGYCLQKQNKPVNAMAHYYKALTTRTCIAEALQQLKTLSHDTDSAIAVSANLYQWFYNQNTIYLETAFSNSAKEATKFALEHSQNEAFSMTNRISLLLKALTQKELPQLENLLEKLLQNMKDVANKTPEHAIAMAKEINRVLRDNPNTRYMIVMRSAASPDKYPEKIRAALLHFELQEPHAPDEHQQLTILWNSMSIAARNEVEKQSGAAVEAIKQIMPAEQASTSSSSSSSSVATLSKEAKLSIRQVIEGQISILETAKIPNKDIIGILEYWIKLTKRESRDIADLNKRDAVIRKLPEDAEELLMEIYIDFPNKMSPSIDENTTLQAKGLILQTLEEMAASIRLRKEPEQAAASMAQAASVVGHFKAAEPPASPAIDLNALPAAPSHEPVENNREEVVTAAKTALPA